MTPTVPTATLSDTQKVTITVTPQDNDKQPTGAVGNLSPTSANTAVCTLSNFTATTFDVLATGVGSTVVTINCLDATGTVVFFSTLDVVVSAGVATSYAVTVGTPVAQ